MKFQNVKLSLLILTGLVILSYGFLISAQEGSGTSANIFTAAENQTASNTPNMTKDVAQTLSTIVTSADPTDQQISLETLQQKINDSVSKGFSENDLPEISIDSIKIKEQNYKGTASQIKDRKKEDFSNYMVAVYYILSSNSPKPITSNSDVLNTFNSIIFDIAMSIGSRQSNSLDEISRSGEKMFVQLQDIEVPEELVGLHIKALRFTQYAMSLKDTISVNTADPLLDLSNLVKLESFIESLATFSNEAQTKFAEYGIDYDDIMMQKINSLGAPAPDPEELEKAATEIRETSANTSSATDSAAIDSSTN